MRTPNMLSGRRVAVCRERMISQRGTVTAEAAIGMFALALMLVLGVQLILLGIQQVRLTAAATEATRIAAASGQLSLRISQAEAFLQKTLPTSVHRITSDGSSIHIELKAEGHVVLLPFALVLSAKATSPLIDTLAVVL